MKKRKIGGKPLSARYMKSYIAKNTVRLTRKMKRAKDAGWYKGSSKLQSASSTLRYLYRKYDYNPDQYHTGKSFINNLKSWNEIKAMYNALKKIDEANSYAAKRALKRKETQFANLMEQAKQKAIAEGKRVRPNMFNTSYSERFDLLSDLSSEFHEIFAFMTYEEAETFIAEGNDTIEQLLSAYYRKIEDWDWKNEPRIKEKNIMSVKTHVYLSNKYANNPSKVNRVFLKIKGGKI